MQDELGGYHKVIWKAVAAEIKNVHHRLKECYASINYGK